MSRGLMPRLDFDSNRQRRKRPLRNRWACLLDLASGTHSITAFLSAFLPLGDICPHRQRPSLRHLGDDRILSSLNLRILIWESSGKFCRIQSCVSVRGRPLAEINLVGSAMSSTCAQAWIGHLPAAPFNMMSLAARPVPLEGVCFSVMEHQTSWKLV
jgi:hypothetical protein